jgi:hypothetical protein
MTTSELERLRAERKMLEKQIEEKAQIEIEKEKIQQLKDEDRKSSSFFHRSLKTVKSLGAEVEQSLHPERFRKDGTRRKK